MNEHGARLSQQRLSRRRFSALLGGGALAASLLPGRRFAPPAAAQEIAIVDPETSARVASIGESSRIVYVEETGHTMSGVLLDYWRATGRAALFGNPISEPFETADGVYGQAMEYGVIQFLPELLWTLEPFVRFMPAGRTLLGGMNGGFRNDGRRMGGGGNPRARDWALPAGELLSGAVGYGEPAGVEIDTRFSEWYATHEGRFYLGLPLTPLLTERGQPAQWFEGGLLLDDSDGPRLAPLGKELAARLGVSVAPVSQGDLPTDNEDSFLVVPNPLPTGADPAGSGRKRIDVDISEQTVRAYAGDKLVLETFCSTGLWPNKTETGEFRIRYKTRLEDMRGATDPNGKVVWVAGDHGGPPAGSIPYGVPDVPNVMYVNLEAEALHGAYWHNNFGAVMSHGCINLPLEVAAFLYEWAPLGTPVRSFLHEGMVYPGSEGHDPSEGVDYPVGTDTGAVG
ncbi:MAG: L,D-transpeptidase [Thermomicrobiales bacterium]|nr:L,D-transpeptidase [Thermomicrobiales bacterium]